MPLTRDSLDDLLLAAMGLLCGTYVNAALPLQGGDAINTVYTFPLSLDVIPAVKTPALAIYRTRSRFVQHGPVRTWWRETIRIDYFAPRTPLKKLDERWPLLHQVAVRLLDAMCDGKVNGVDVLTPAGLQHVHRDQWDVVYTYAHTDNHAWPVAQTTCVIDWEEPKADEGLPDATELLAQQLRDDASGFIVTSLHTLP